jgi:mRNA-degrading endonuclease RelE of RelBE toxin-antitoxin system
MRPTDLNEPSRTTNDGCPAASSYRLRVGDWRAIFDYDRTTQRLLVPHFLPRGRPSER